MDNLAYVTAVNDIIQKQEDGMLAKNCGQYRKKMLIE